jgi:uncharacterized Zn finger protein
MNTVDKLAEIRAKIADLKKLETLLVNELKQSGTGTYDGTTHYAVVSEFSRETLDMDAVREKLSRQFIKAHTKVTEGLQIRLYGYSRKAAA